MTKYEEKLNKLNGQQVDDFFGLMQNLFNVGINDNEIFAWKTKDFPEGTQYDIEFLNGEKFVIFVNSETQLIEF